MWSGERIDRLRIKKLPLISVAVQQSEEKLNTPMVSLLHTAFIPLIFHLVLQTKYTKYILFKHRNKTRTLDVLSPHLFDVLSLHHILIPHFHSRVEEALYEVC